MGFWDSETVLGEIEKNDSEKIIIKEVTKGSNTFIDIRTFYLSGDEYKPSNKGIAIPSKCVEDVKSIISNL